MANLDEIRAKRAELARKRAESEKAAAEAAELEKEQKMLDFEVAADEIAVKYGPRGVKWDVANTVAGPVIVMRPSGAEYKRFDDSEKTGSAEIERFMFPLVLHPAKSVFERMYEDQPAIAVDIVTVIAALAGNSRAAATKK